MIDGLLPKGNVLTFSDYARKVSISHKETNEFPTQTNYSEKIDPSDQLAVIG